MQGIKINGQWAKTKKAVKQAVSEAPETVYIVGTSLFGNEYDGPLLDAPNGRIDFVGPDPYNSRKFYGNIYARGTAGVSSVA